MRPIGIDLFAGAGGMSLGFEQAGFDVVAAVEFDPIHAMVHKFNFPRCEVLARSVVGLTGAEIRRAAKIENRAVDVVFGGAPCQGFSLIGQRALDDPRNGLVKEFVRIVHELDASYFVFENVKGLTVGRHKSFLQELIGEFENRGYSVVKKWKVLNSADYGVPQDRQRLILLGSKKGLPLPKYPEPKTFSAGLGVEQRFGDGQTTRLEIGPSVFDALGDLPDAEKFVALLNSDSVQTSQWGQPSRYALEMRCKSNDAWHFGYPRKWDPLVLTSSMRTDHTDISRRRFANTTPGEVEPISRFFRLPKNGVANTLRAGTDSARGAFTSPRPIHFKYPRCITVREMARLHGFPDWFRFHVTKWHGAREIGNAVAPPLARYIGAEVIKALGVTPNRPRGAIPLGNIEWLAFDMRQASEYWGIAVPIGKRNKKSGAKKRKQIDIERHLAAE